MINEKKRLRAEFRARRDGIDKNIREAESRKIADRLINSEIYRQAGTIFAYVSLGSEVETTELLCKILADGKRLAVPLCDVAKRTMSAVEICGLSELVRGSYGIQEPNGENAKILGADEIDLVIVPALAFDRSGMRLGYGGGYYDKFLAGFTGISTGLAYSECIADALPAEELDCRVNNVICPKEMIQTWQQDI